MTKSQLSPELLARAARVFGSEEEAERWLHRRAVGLNGQRPIDLLRSVEGSTVVEDFLTRVEYAVYT